MLTRWPDTVSTVKWSHGGGHLRAASIVRDIHSRAKRELLRIRSNPGIHIKNHRPFLESEKVGRMVEDREVVRDGRSADTQLSRKSSLPTFERPGSPP